MDFKLTVQSENIWVPREEIHKIPGVIQKTYEYLKESVQKDDICSALFRLKDLYEISMKIPAIMAIISICSYVEADNGFIRRTNEQLLQEHNDFVQGNKKEEESEAFKKFGLILARLLREPLSIGGWRELIGMIVDYSALFELDNDLVSILLRTAQLHKVRPRIVNGEHGRYEDVGNWRNKTIGHGTLAIHTEDYWEQVYDLVEGLHVYFSKDKDGRSLNNCYENINIVQEKNNTCEYVLQIGNKRHVISEYIYFFDNKYYFFDSYYSRQGYTEVTNYFSAPIRLKSNSYYQNLYSLYYAAKKSGTKKRGRQITNSTDREMYACLNSISDYEKPVFVIDEIKKFIEENDKGILYIQMERGMGKSTLAHRLDGRYQRGILQKDMNAVVRVYHISDMHLRGEDKGRDFFTSLNTNLTSYDGGQLEVDDEEFFDADGNDLRQLVKGENEDAQIAFSEYLNLFRRRYEDELYGGGEGDTINLVYIVDGIDELNSDTGNILNAIPSNDILKALPGETADHIYIVLLSRLREEESLPDAAKECISISERKSGKIFTVDSNNEEYIALLKNYISHNYKDISEPACEEIIERAQRKFLYIRPYMALGDVIIKSDEKLTAYAVAQNYAEELQRLYCGISLNTLQLIISAIAVFHTISLKEICNLVLFTDISYDAVGVLNDIVPLLTTRRSDGEDVYEYANEEYEQYVLTELHESVCEVICRFRISINSWFEKVDKKSDSYGKEWGVYVKKLLFADNLANTIDFEEVSEEYIKTLILLSGRENPGTLYSRGIDESLKVNIIDQLENLKCKELSVLTLQELKWVGREFAVCEKLSGEYPRRLGEYTQGIVMHCIAVQKIDIWFELLTEERLSIKFDPMGNFNKTKIIAFRRIMEKWKDQNEVVHFFTDKVMADYKDNRSDSYGIYLEELLDIVKTDSLKEKVYESLLYVYKMLADDILDSPVFGNIDDDRRETILKIINEAAAYTNPCNFDFIEEIRDCLSREYIIDKTISDLEHIPDMIQNLSSQEYCDKFSRTKLDEEYLNKEQLIKYKDAKEINYSRLLKYIKDVYDGNNKDDIYPWLPVFSGRDFFYYSENRNKEVLEWLDLYEDIVKGYAKELSINKIHDLKWSYKRFLECYDENVREVKIGLYRNCFDEKYDISQKLTHWEKTFALYCSGFDDVFTLRDIKDIPYTANDFMNKLLQELYDENEYEEYFLLNRKIEKTYSNLEFVKKFLTDSEYINSVIIRNYFRWICIRYYRSLDGKDHSSSEMLYERLMEEYKGISDRLLSVLDNDEELLDMYNRFLFVKTIGREMLYLAKMVPDTIISVEDSKTRYIEKLEEIRKKYVDQIEIVNWLNEAIERINEPQVWYNSNLPFVKKNTDRTIFD